MPELVQLLLDISRAIVDEPDEVKIDTKEDGDTVVFTIHVAASDMGKIIGRHGKNAKCIRSVIKAAGTVKGLKTVVDIAEDDR